jgi:hypothetical protein
LDAPGLRRLVAEALKIGTLEGSPPLSVETVYPECLPGYAVIFDGGTGRVVATPEGRRHGVPEAILGSCNVGCGLCWWVRPIGLPGSLPLNAAGLKGFKAKG